MEAGQLWGQCATSGTGLLNLCSAQCNQKIIKQHTAQCQTALSQLQVEAPPTGK